MADIVKQRELLELNRRANEILYSLDTWEDKYSLIFSEELSRRVWAITKELGKKLDYYDPDTSYEEDVRAFIDAFNRWTRDNVQLVQVTLEGNTTVQLSRGLVGMHLLKFDEHTKGQEGQDFFHQIAVTDRDVDTLIEMLQKLQHQIQEDKKERPFW